MAVRSFLAALVKNSRGATAVEYGLILALIVLGMFASLKTVADQTIRLWNYISVEVTASR